jgi:hypothetical protein
MFAPITKVNEGESCQIHLALAHSVEKISKALIHV